MKLAALVCIYFFRPGFKFQFRFRNSRLPLFYLLVIGIALINYCITAGFAIPNYTITFLIGIGFWIFSILAIHQIKLSVEGNEPRVIHKTIYIFFIINTIVSVITFLIIIWQTKTLNPYLYQGQYQKYFIGTGDYIKGISFDTSTTNAVLNGFGVIYFLQRKQAAMALLCMIILLMTGSNVINIIVSLVLLFMFIFQSDKIQKSLIAICYFLLIVFMTKISPQNNNYMVNFFNNFFDKGINVHKNILQSDIKKLPDSSLTPEERRQKIAMLYLDSMTFLENEKQNFIGSHTLAIPVNLSLPVDDINSPQFQHKSFVTPVEQNMFHFIDAHSSALPMSADILFHAKYPGKIIAWKQTLNYFKQHPSKIITGTGIGNFSSKLAFKTTALDIAGSYPEKYKYISHDFLANHLDVYLYFFSKEDGLHSITNSPGSVYDWLLSEYGIIGLLAFFLFYIGFFIKKLNLFSYSIPCILLLSAILFFDYWFEQLSIIIFFELLIFLNMKEKVNRL